MEVIDVEIRPGVSRELPAWMTDEAACAAMSQGTPQVVVAALVELRAVLQPGSTTSSLADLSDADRKQSDETITKGNTRTVHSCPPSGARSASRRKKEKEELLMALADLLLEAVGMELSQSINEKEVNDESEDHA
jgi:hypothetical protein